MKPNCDRINESPLEAARNREEYELHLAALEWGVEEAIVINSAEDIQSRPRWEEVLEPYEHQVKHLFTFCRRLPVTPCRRCRFRKNNQCWIDSK